MPALHHFHRVPRTLSEVSSGAAWGYTRHTQQRTLRRQPQTLAELGADYMAFGPDGALYFSDLARIFRLVP